MRVIIRIWIGGARGCSHTRGFADQLFIFHPDTGAAPPFKGRQPHEGFIIEARGEKSAEQPRNRAKIMAHIGPCILAIGFKPGIKLLQRGFGIWLCPIAAAQRDYRAGFFDARGHHAARAVIFKTAPQNALPVRHQCRGQRIALKSLQFLAIPGKFHRLRAINPTAGCKTARAH